MLEEAGGSIAYRFPARDVHLVLSPGAESRFPSGCASTGRLRAGPTARTSTKAATAPPGGRLYQLVRQHDAVRQRTLEITFLQPGAKAYSFTFG